jgi:hypothetical protein
MFTNPWPMSLESFSSYPLRPHSADATCCKMHRSMVAERSSDKNHPSDPSRTSPPLSCLQVVQRTRNLLPLPKHHPPPLQECQYLQQLHSPRPSKGSIYQIFHHPEYSELWINHRARPRLTPPQVKSDRIPVHCSYETLQQAVVPYIFLTHDDLLSIASSVMGASQNSLRLSVLARAWRTSSSFVPGPTSSFDIFTCLKAFANSHTSTIVTTPCAKPTEFEGTGLLLFGPSPEHAGQD